MNSRFFSGIAGVPIQAHRGAGTARPENTLESCLYTWNLSPSLIPELDVSTNADGVLVAFHDSELLSPKARSSFSQEGLLRIADGLDLLKERLERRLYLDYKNASLPALASCIREKAVEGQVALATPNHAQASAWRGLLPGAETLVWVWNNGAQGVAEAVGRLRGKGFRDITQLQLHISCLPSGEFVPDAEFIRELAAELKGRGIMFQAFPFQGRFAEHCRPEVFPHLREMGVTSFATDFPEEALDALARL